MASRLNEKLKELSAFIKSVQQLNYSLSDNDKIKAVFYQQYKNLYEYFKVVPLEQIPKTHIKFFYLLDLGQESHSDLTHILFQIKEYVEIEPTVEKTFIEATPEQTDNLVIGSLTYIEEILLKGLSHPSYLKFLRKDLNDKEMEELSHDFLDYHIDFIRNLVSSLKAEKIGLFVSYVLSGHFKDDLLQYIENHQLHHLTIKEFSKQNDLKTFLMQQMELKEKSISYLYDDETDQNHIAVQCFINDKPNITTNHKPKNTIDSCMVNHDLKVIVVGQCTADLDISKQGYSFYKAQEVVQQLVKQEFINELPNLYYNYQVKQFLLPSGLIPSETSSKDNKKQMSNRKFYSHFEPLTAEEQQTLSEVIYYSYFNNATSVEKKLSLLNFEPYVIGVNTSHIKKFIENTKKLSTNEEKERAIFIQLATYLNDSAQILVDKFIKANSQDMTYYLNAFINIFSSTLNTSNINLSKEDYNLYLKPLYLKLNKICDKFDSENLSQIYNTLIEKNDKIENFTSYTKYIQRIKKFNNSTYYQENVQPMNLTCLSEMISILNQHQADTFKGLSFQGNLEEKQENYDLLQSYIKLLNDMNHIRQKKVQHIEDILSQIKPSLSSNNKTKQQEFYKIEQEFIDFKSFYAQRLQLDRCSSDKESRKSFISKEDAFIKKLITYVKNNNSFSLELTQAHYQNQYKHSLVKQMYDNLSFLHNKTCSTQEYNQQCYYLNQEQGIFQTLLNGTSFHQLQDIASFDYSTLRKNYPQSILSTIQKMRESTDTIDKLKPD